MTTENCPTISSGESTESSSAKQRKKRRWDQPAELLVPAGVVVPGILPLANMGFLPGITSCGMTTVVGASFTSPLTSIGATLTSVLQAPLHQHTVTIPQKITQPKDELIAREVIINDAEASVRYKLTKRQTQEEIQKCTGAIVITRGKYRPPTAPFDGEKPLYLHISASAHLETTVEKIKAVDSAAAMVEEILRQGAANDGPKVNHLISQPVNQPYSTCVFLGFEAQPSLNIASRIRGPNDQYVNHIMNETGAAVSLRGQGSGNSENLGNDEGQQPLHLLLASNNLQSLERAKLLAENLMDTISAEFCSTRVSSSKVYGAVPPPPQLSDEVQSSQGEPQPKNLSVGSSTSLCHIPSSDLTVKVAGFPSAASQSVISPAGWCTTAQSQMNAASDSRTSLSGRTSYNGYEGIYPQATPLQQVALALRQSTSPVTATVSPSITSVCSTSSARVATSLEKERRSSQKRKFQELPLATQGEGLLNQGAEVSKLSGLTSDLGKKDAVTILGSDKLAESSIKGALEKKFSTKGMRPSPPRTMPPPPPPPPQKFVSPAPGVLGGKNMLLGSTSKSIPDALPDTLIKLMEYGDESEDEDEIEEKAAKPFKGSSSTSAGPKPFWAV